MDLSYNICSSRYCNICILLEIEMQAKGTPMKRPKHIKLFKCSGCKLVLYCSEEHQRIDWQMHRNFCRAISLIMRNCQVPHPYYINGVPKDEYALGRAIVQVKYLLRTLFGRNLEFREEELASYPAYCEICYNMIHLRSCNDCYGVSYCSTEHAKEDLERHRKKCGLLQLYYSPYKVQVQMPSEVLLDDLQNPVEDFLTKDLFGAWEQITSKKLPKNPTLSIIDYQLFACAADFSCMGTICFTLSFTDMKDFAGTKFIIFILGATIEQDFWFRQIHTKWFFLQYPQFTSLELHFIGPDVMGSDIRDITYNYNGCDRSVLYVRYRMLFQDFAKEVSLTPSLIAAFNCDFCEYFPPVTFEQSEVEEPTGGNPSSIRLKKDTWPGAIQELLLTYNLPILFTSMTRVEAIYDFDVLRRVLHKEPLGTRICRLFKLTVNPFRDIRPLRNWRKHSGEDEICFRNGYLQAVVTRLDTYN
ncbi:uncharacterized protein LOC129249162 [Anastrepha obliqua]|uniref:uncharacterized protein LOC129249162 n=1 Tax=Anastrepha obliqua TaxID=95512 RepID=UPI00240A23F6|nr:uncharacterized protein LOC129249162 [Anastrepha obliqua]